MATLKFGSLVKKIRLTQEAAKYDPDDEVAHLRAEVRFLKNILHMKQSATGGISQILYNMKKLKEENDALKRLSRSQAGIETIAQQNVILQQRLAGHGKSIAGGQQLPYIRLPKKRDSILQRSSGFSKLSVHVREDAQSKDFASPVGPRGRASPLRVSFQRSFAQLPGLDSPGFQTDTKQSKTEVSLLDETLGLSVEPKSQSFRIEFAKKSKFGLSKQEGLPTIKVERSLGEKSFKNLVADTRLGASKSENASATKITFSQFMQGQRPTVAQKTAFSSSHFRKSSRPHPARSQVARSMPARQFGHENRPSDLGEFGYLRSKLQGIEARLLRIDVQEDSLTTKEPQSAGFREPHALGTYQRTLKGIRREMDRVSFC